MPCNTLVAAIASGGDTMPPNKKPMASVNPGIIACAVNAMAADVKITRPIDNNPIGLLLAQKSFQDVFHAAEYNKGGRKMMKTTSGCRLTSGIPGIRLINKPATTRKIG
jgi:hypothetical protein